MVHISLTALKFRKVLLLLPLLLAMPAQAFTEATVLVPVNDRLKEQTVSFRVQVADTDAERQTGLMHRDSMGEWDGMWFPFEPARDAGMWMKNTRIPLDMVFIGKDSRIVKIHTHAKPGDETLIDSGEPVIAVLELEAGDAASNGLAVGQKVELQ